MTAWDIPNTKKFKCRMLLKANKVWKDFRYKLALKYLNENQDGGEPDSETIRESDGDSDFDGDEKSEGDKGNNDIDHLNPKDWDVFVNIQKAPEFVEKISRGRENQKKNLYPVITSRWGCIMVEEKLVEKARQAFEKEIS